MKVDDDKGIKHELLEATMRRSFSIDIFGIISLKFSMISSVSIEKDSWIHLIYANF